MPELSGGVLVEVSERVATVTLNRPDRLNAMDREMEHDLADELDRLDRDDNVRVVILTGAGRAFCAGADLGGGASTFDVDRQADVRARAGTIGGVPRDGGALVTLQIAAMRTPVIAAVNGAAVGLGATITLAADIRIASESSRFGFVFVRRGIVMEAASSWFLPRVVGISQASEWVLSGRLFGSDEALSGRLVSRVVPDDDLLKVAGELAAEIAGSSAVAVAASRQLLWSSLAADSPWDAHRWESGLLAQLGQGPDAAEGVRAFLDKRPPAFAASAQDDYPTVVPSWPAVPQDVEIPSSDQPETEQ